MKILTFTGSGSSGKSTLLRELQRIYKDNPSWFFVQETTRNLNKESINNTAIDYNLTQIEISNIHRNNCNLYNNYSTVVLPRCALDGAIYTEYFYQHNKVSSTTRAVAWQTWEELKKHYTWIFYPDPSEVPLIDDGTRSTDLEFRNTIIELYQPFLRSSNRLIILKGNIEKRLDTIKNIINIP